MQAFALTRSRVLVIFSLVGCMGLDPQRFDPDGRSRSLGGQAGYAFDAGLAGVLSSGGAAGSGTRGPAGGGRNGATSAAGGTGVEAEPTGGEAGAQDSTQGGAPSGPARSGGRSGSSSAGEAGVWGRGAEAGSPMGAASGRGGQPALGGAGGMTELAGNGGHGGIASGGFGGSEGGTAGDVSEPPARAFFFSEYVEGSSSYKALELTAEVASSLDGCELVTYSNGSTTGGSIALAASVPAGSVYTLCSTTLADILGMACDRATNLSFNGDDAVALACVGVTIDVVGQIGVDPGTAWVGPSGSTLNATLRRRCDHLAPEPNGTDPFDPDIAYAPLPVDTFDGLGDPTCG
jgi:hypothetical protein